MDLHAIKEKHLHEFANQEKVKINAGSEKFVFLNPYALMNIQ